MNQPRSRQHRLVFRKKSWNTLSCFIRLFRLIPLRLIQGLNKIPTGLRSLSRNPSSLSLSLTLFLFFCLRTMCPADNRKLHACTNNSIRPKVMAQIVQTFGNLRDRYTIPIILTRYFNQAVYIFAKGRMKNVYGLFCNEILKIVKKRGRRTGGNLLSRMI